MRVKLGYYLFREGSIGKQEDLRDSQLVESLASLHRFLGVLYIGTVEEMKASGKSQKIDLYGTNARRDLPTLYDAIRRIDCYRNFFSHGELRKETEAEFRQFLELDFFDRSRQWHDKDARLVQQIVLEELYMAIQDGLFTVGG